MVRFKFDETATSRVSHFSLFIIIIDFGSYGNFINLKIYELNLLDRDARRDKFCVSLHNS